MKILIIIPARAGSKGIPGKNMRLFRGKPLIDHTVEQALELSKIMPYPVMIVISTDMEEIINREYPEGVKIIKRPKKLAQDDTAMEEVVYHVLSLHQRFLRPFEKIILLQPTSPLRTVSDIRDCLTLSIKRQCSVASVKKVSSSQVYKSVRMYPSGRMKPVAGDFDVLGSPRQKLPDVYMPNGAVYVCSERELDENGTLFNENTVGYVMDESRSLDIDTEEDLKESGIMGLPSPVQQARDI